MKKWIYLTLGLVLFIIPIVNGLGLQPITDSYSLGQDIGVLIIPIIGLVLIYKYFRISRKERVKKKVKSE